MAIPSRPARGRKPIRRRPGKRIVEGKSFRLADEVRYIQRRAADHDGRIVTVGQLVLFSTETTFAIGWKGRYRIDGPAFVYSDHDTGRVATILGYPTDKLSQIA